MYLDILILIPLLMTIGFFILYKKSKKKELSSYILLVAGFITFVPVLIWVLGWALAITGHNIGQ